MQKQQEGKPKEDETPQINKMVIDKIKKMLVQCQSFILYFSGQLSSYPRWFKTHYWYSKVDRAGGTQNIRNQRWAVQERPNEIWINIQASAQKA